MNKDVRQKAKILNQWILNQKIVIEYQKYEHLIQKHTKLKELENELKCLQQQIVQAKHFKESCNELIEEYQRKKEIFDSHPLVNNYLILKEEVNTLLTQIQDEINVELKKKS